MEELFEEEFEERFDDEFELEFDELFEDELELELLDEFELEFDELLPATTIAASLWLLDCFPPSGRIVVYSLACTAAEPASAATPATRAVLSFQDFFMPVTPFENRTGCSGPAE
ncbi:hypothetical protein [Rhizobium sp. 007]|uniref:hypothetical protein n=1 Tax=Rhizobium sp. 007 TaxID=2785056 RepID=UPI00189043CB|nr:hypothetical protein [Rhizobium sp. 007]QPB23267.1 hypothetical protein ISN39_27505 [Rhizobium sp. 007]